MRRMAYYYARHSGRYAYETISRRCQFVDRQRLESHLKSVINCAVNAIFSKKLFPLYASIMRHIVLQSRLLNFLHDIQMYIYVWRNAKVNCMYLQWLVINTSCVTTSPCVLSLYFIVSRSMRRLPKNLATRFSLSPSKYYGVSLRRDQRRDLSWGGHSRVNNVARDEDELAVTAADISRFRKISENSPPPPGFRSRDLHFT